MAIVTYKDKKIELGKNLPTVIIGERLNATSSRKLAEELTLGKFDLLMKEALCQKQAGAQIIDVNVACSGIEEETVLPVAVLKALEASELPICIDSSNWKAIRKTLEVYPYKALVNSVTGQEKSLKNILPLVKDYGASFVFLTMDDNGIPKTAQGRYDLAKVIIEAAESYNIPRDDIIIDCLCQAQAGEPNSAEITLEAVRKVSRELGVATVVGVSNVSFGMPERKIINLSFLAQAIFQGVSAVIIDPTVDGVRETVLASDFLAGRDPYGKRYLAGYREKASRKID